MTSSDRAARPAEWDRDWPDLIDSLTDYADIEDRFFWDQSGERYDGVVVEQRELQTWLATLLAARLVPAAAAGAGAHSAFKQWRKMLEGDPPEDGLMPGSWPSFAAGWDMARAAAPVVGVPSEYAAWRDAVRVSDSAEAAWREAKRAFYAQVPALESDRVAYWQAVDRHDKACRAEEAALAVLRAAALRDDAAPVVGGGDAVFPEDTGYHAAESAAYALGYGRGLASKGLTPLLVALEADADAFIVLAGFPVAREIATERVRALDVLLEGGITARPMPRADAP